MFSLLLLTASTLTIPAQFQWAVGMDDNGWPAGDGGGPNASFVQENGSINPLPGDPNSPETDQQADNDYYFAGVYSTPIQSVVDLYGDYTPIDVVAADEEAAERAFAGGDLDLRYHFNLPDTLNLTNRFTVTFDALNLDTSAANTDPRFGVEVWVNGVKVQNEILIRGAQLNKAYTTPQFSLAQVNAQLGSGFDNIVSLRGVSYNNDGGGNWMGIDYVQFNQATEVIPPAVFPWSVGKEDDAWAVGDGGGTNATFVQASAATNALPGVANSPEVNGQADNDYYFAGSYTTTIPSVVAAYGDYQPLGTVAVNEEGAQGGLSGANTELRYHFNLPNSLQPSDLLAVTFDALDLGATGADPRFTVEVFVNGVRVQPGLVIRPTDLDKLIKTPTFTLASVNAQVGPGFDNIVTIRGSSSGGTTSGNNLGIDFVALTPVAKPVPPPVLPWAVGQNDNGWPAGNGGGVNASFVQENGVTNPLPGDPNSPETNGLADNDYYLAGVYSSIITGNGTYSPVGEVPANEEAAERALTPDNTELRYHFNLPANLSPTDQLSIAFDVLNLDDSATDPHYGIEVYVNNVKVLPEVVIHPAEVGVTFNTAPFTLASANIQPGPGFDNIVTLKGIAKTTENGGAWMGIDFVQMNPVLPPPFPWQVGKDDNGQPIGNGGGANASFVQENGSINPLPGNPANPEVNQQSDNDYYFAGIYTNTIPGVVTEYGDYTPVGTVLVNEESAERAFAGSDNDLRYHFNLPSTLKPTDQLLVTFDAFNLDTGVNNVDPRYGIEVWVNGVKIQDEIDIHPTDIDVDYTTAPFTLADVGAQVGPGYDNIVSLKGINFNGDGGGNWMGIDYVRLDPMPKPVFPLQIGKDDNGWPLGNGGGPEASFVQENGTISDLPGTPHSPEINQQADNDYYFAGIYTNTIPSVVAAYGDYTPVGIVVANEEAAERAFAGDDNDLRYHFNLPDTLKPTNQLTVTFDALNLDDPSATVTEPRYGIEIYFNGVKVQDQIVIRTNNLGVAYTTPPFTLASVNAQTGLGPDNIVSLRGVSYSAEGGGSWMGIDYVKVEAPSAAPLKFNASTVSNGKITISWTGSGTLEWAPAVGGPWNPVSPAPTGGTYTEDIVAGQNRFYRLRSP
jgi:hypothetical protein